MVISFHVINMLSQARIAGGTKGFLHQHDWKTYKQTFGQGFFHQKDQEQLCILD